MRSLGLSEVKTFDPQERIIEYRLAEPSRLVNMTLRGFINELSADSPAPGGGSVSALAGAMGAGLAAMVANLSHAKKGMEARQPDFERIAVRGQQLKDKLLAAVDADTAAFDKLLDAMRMRKETPEEIAARDAALNEATVGAIEIPLGVLESCPEVIELCREIGKIGLQASLSDAGVGTQVARAAAAGAYQNVCINMSGLGDKKRAKSLIKRADAAWERVKSLHAEAEVELLTGLREQAGNAL
jgi:glutamate formiminotransferase/formiminotetrahydrofolate cyclodeaminase